MTRTRIAALIALVAVTAFSDVSRAWTKQAIDAYVSNASCLNDSGQNDFGTIYNGCASPIHVTMPATYSKGSGGNADMSVSGNGSSTIVCHITVTNFTATSYWFSANYNFPSNHNNTKLDIPAPTSVPSAGAESAECNLPPNSYLFAYSFTAN